MKKMKNTMKSAKLAGVDKVARRVEKAQKAYDLAQEKKKAEADEKEG